jgi:hypothetical protein
MMASMMRSNISTGRSRSAELTLHVAVDKCDEGLTTAHEGDGESAVNARGEHIGTAGVIDETSYI